MKFYLYNTLFFCTLLFYLKINNNKTVNDDQSSQSDSSVGPGTQDAGSIQLNNNIQTMIRILRDIDNNTGKAVNIMAGSGNMFRR